MSRDVNESARDDDDKRWMQCAHCAQQVTHGTADDTQKSRSTRHMDRTVRTLPYGCPLCVACRLFSQFPYSIAIRHIRSLCLHFIFSHLVCFAYAWFHLVCTRNQLHTEWHVHFRLGTLSTHHTVIPFDDKIWLLFLLGFIIHRKHHQRHSKNPIKLICRCVDGRSIKTCIQTFSVFVALSAKKLRRWIQKKGKKMVCSNYTKHRKYGHCHRGSDILKHRNDSVESNWFSVFCLFISVCLPCASFRWWARRARETRSDDDEPDRQRRWHKNVPAMSFDRSFFWAMRTSRVSSVRHIFQVYWPHRH